MFLLWSFLEIENMNPSAIRGTARIEMSALNPSHDTSHAVTVVPILAPIITLMAWTRVSRPAFTKLTTITVVALEDCITVVIPNPVRTPFNGLDVIEDKKLRSLSPAAF